MHSLDWGALSTEMAHAHWFHAIPILLALLTYFAVKAARWHFLIRPLATVPTRRLLAPVVVGIAGNYIVPHAGEIARTILASKRLHLPVAALLATVVIERVFDFLSLLLIAVVIMTKAGQLAPDIRTATWGIGIFCAVLFSAVVIFLVYHEPCLRIVERLLAPTSKHFRLRILHLLQAANAGFSAIANPRLLVPVFLLSLLQWILILTCVALSLHAVGIAVTFAAAISVLLLNVIGITLPAAPGHVGTVQLAFTVALAPFGVSQPDAIAASLIYNFLTVVPALILGMSGLRRAGMLMHRHVAR